MDNAELELVMNRQAQHIIGLQNALYVLTDLIARQPAIRPELLRSNLQTALGAELVGLVPPTVPILQHMLEIVERCNPQMTR